MDTIAKFTQPLLELTTEELQAEYDKFLRVKPWGSTSPVVNWLRSLGYSTDLETTRPIRQWLASRGVIGRVGDAQCMNLKTKLIKSEQMTERRSDPEVNKELNAKLHKGRWEDKSTEELKEIAKKQSKTLSKTQLQKKESDPEGWAEFQKSVQEKSMLTKRQMPLEVRQLGYNKQKNSYWAKPPEERAAMQTKREQNTKYGFWFCISCKRKVKEYCKKKDLPCSCVNPVIIWMGSEDEKHMWLFLTDLKIPFRYHHDSILLFNNERKRTWNLDFFLPEHNTILETKGSNPQSLNEWPALVLDLRRSTLSNDYRILVLWNRWADLDFKTLEEMFAACEEIKSTSDQLSHQHFIT